MSHKFQSWHSNTGNQESLDSTNPGAKDKLLRFLKVFTWCLRRNYDTLIFVVLFNEELGGKNLLTSVTGEWRHREASLWWAGSWTERVWRTEVLSPLFCNSLIKAETGGILKWEGKKAALVPAKRLYRHDRAPSCDSILNEWHLLFMMTLQISLSSTLCENGLLDFSDRIQVHLLSDILGAVPKHLWSHSSFFLFMYLHSQRTWTLHTYWRVKWLALRST